MLIREKLTPKTPINTGVPSIDELALLALQGGYWPEAERKVNVQSMIGAQDVSPAPVLGDSKEDTFFDLSNAQRFNGVRRDANQTLFPDSGKVNSLDEVALLMQNQISEPDDPVFGTLLNNPGVEKSLGGSLANGTLTDPEPLNRFAAGAQRPVESRGEERPKTTLELNKRSKSCEQLIRLIYNLDKQLYDRKVEIQESEIRIEGYRSEIDRLSQERSELLVDVPDGLDRGKGNKRKEKAKEYVGNISSAVKLKKIREIDAQIGELEDKLEEERKKLNELQRRQAMTERSLSEKGNELEALGCQYSPAEVDHIPER